MSLWTPLCISRMSLDQSASSLRELAEETLAYGLFACALLTNYSLKPDVFFLNLAVGVRLATEMKVFKRKKKEDKGAKIKVNL